MSVSVTDCRAFDDDRREVPLLRVAPDDFGAREVVTLDDCAEVSPQDLTLLVSLLSLLRLRLVGLEVIVVAVVADFASRGPLLPDRTLEAFTELAIW
jgi:hypothetical protein